MVFVEKDYISHADGGHRERVDQEYMCAGPSVSDCIILNLPRRMRCGRARISHARLARSAVALVLAPTRAGVRPGSDESLGGFVCEQCITELGLMIG